MTKAITSSISRRKAMGVLALGVAATGVYAAKKSVSKGRITTRIQSWWQLPPVNLATAGLSEWASQVGSVFEMDSELGTGSIVLQTVEPFRSLGVRPRDVGRSTGFATGFVSMGGPLPAGDRTYTLRRMGSPDLNVYFSPAGQRLVAVFN
jgi:hypothetical protein